MVCAIVNLVLFAKPLCRMTKSMGVRESEDTTNNAASRAREKMRHMARKTSVLGIWSVVTSLFSIGMIFVLNTTELWLSLDLIANAICLMLVFSRNEPIFRCICGCMMGELKHKET
eukprot:405561_1